MSRNVKSAPSEGGVPAWEPEVAPNVLSLIPYVAGKPIEETKREFGLNSVIKLASNENPLGPSPMALEAVSSKLKEIHLYPDASHHDLKLALSRRLEVSPLHLAIGNGSDELVDLLIRTFVPPGKNTVSPKYSFVAYRLRAQIQGADYLEAPVDRDFKCTAEDILKTINADTRMVIMANPGNPTGSWMGASELFALASRLNERRILLVLDYAYWEYVATPEIPAPSELLGRFGNVLILRTFSKIYGLAGLRVGYLTGKPSIVSIIERARQPFNVWSLAMIAATAALADQDFVNRAHQLNLKSKAALLQKLGLKTSFEGNFVLLDLGKPAHPFYQEFLKRGVILRPLVNYGLPNHLRITTGTAAEMERLFEVMAEIFD